MDALLEFLFIDVTLFDGTIESIKIQDIKSFQKVEKNEEFIPSTRVLHSDGEWFEVKESPSEIKDKIRNQRIIFIESIKEMRGVK